jgi:hypothetical protein
MIDDFAVSARGLKLTFNFPLASAATDPKHYTVTQWNYNWREQYGSKQYHPATGEVGRETVAVDAVRLGADRRSVHLELAKLHKVDQMRVQMTVPTAQGDRFEEQLHLTINKVPNDKGNDADPAR